MLKTQTIHRPGKRNSVCFRVYRDGRLVIQTYGRTVESTLPELIRCLHLLGGYTLSDLRDVEELTENEETTR
jgi:hypothetical protein